MRLLLITPAYAPDPSLFARMVTDLCQFLAEQEHEVHVLCPRQTHVYAVPGDGGALSPMQHHNAARPHTHSDARPVVSAAATPPGPPRPACSAVPSPLPHARPARMLPRTQARHGVAVHRLGISGASETRLARLGFHALAMLHVLSVGWWFDVIITLPQTPRLSLAGALGRLLYRRGHVCWLMSRQCHPFQAFQGRLERLRRLGLRSAHRCVASSSLMARQLRDMGVPQAHIDLIPPWGDEPVYRPHDPNENPMRKAWGLQDRFVVMDAGEAGPADTFETVCAAAKLLARDRRIAFVFLGSGPALQAVAAYRDTHRLPNIRLGPDLPARQRPAALTMADVHLVTLGDGWERVALPLHLPDALAAGRPLLFVGPAQSEPARLIARTGCGLVVPPGDSQGLARTIFTLSDQPDLCRQLGERARQVFGEQFEAQSAHARWDALLEDVRLGREPQPDRASAWQVEG